MLAGVGVAVVPESLWLVESFLNSVDVESGQDDLDSLDRFRRWLRDHRQEGAAGAATDADLALARRLRDGLRSVLVGTAPGELDRLAAGIGLAARFDADGSVRLAAAEPGVRGMLGEVLAAVVRARH